MFVTGQSGSRSGTDTLQDLLFDVSVDGSSEVI